MCIDSCSYKSTNHDKDAFFPANQVETLIWRTWRSPRLPRFAWFPALFPRLKLVALFSRVSTCCLVWFWGLTGFNIYPIYLPTWFSSIIYDLRLSLGKFIRKCIYTKKIDSSDVRHKIAFQKCFLREGTWSHDSQVTWHGGKTLLNTVKGNLLYSMTFQPFD